MSSRLSNASRWRCWHCSAAFFLIVLIAIVFPGFCLLLPFLLAYLGCVLVDRLARIGLK